MENDNIRIDNRNRTIVMRIVLFLLGILALSCSSRKTPRNTTTKVTYIYTDHDSIGNPLDSLKMYDDRPFEESLAFYEATDSLEKNVYGILYLSVFKVDKSKFAILGDSTHTAFYKLGPGGYKRLYKIWQEPGLLSKTKTTDLNKDGFNDVWLSVNSGGTYGDDTYLLFYDPAIESLIYDNKIKLRDVEIKGNTVRSFTRFTSDVYEISGYALRIKESTTFSHGEYEDKKITNYYDDTGTIIKTETQTLRLSD